MKAMMRGVLVVLVLAVILAASGDIVVYRDGAYEEVKIKNTTTESFILEGPYGDLEYPRERIYSAHRSVAARPGEEYYQAGLMMLRLHRKTVAKKLFEKAGQYDSRYGVAGQKALDAYTIKRPADDASRLRSPSSRKEESNQPLYKLTCQLCNGTGKVEYRIQGVTGSDEEGRGEVTRTMSCPACSGKGHRLLYLGPDEGICPTCGGAGSVKEEEGGWVFTYVPCRSCGGRGILPTSQGGTRENLELVSGGPRRRFPDEEEEDEDDKSSDDGDFFTKYRWHIVGGGGALLVIAFLASKMSKKKK